MFLVLKNLWASLHISFRELFRLKFYTSNYEYNLLLKLFNKLLYKLKIFFYCCLNLVVKTTYMFHQIRSDQSLSRVWLFATPWIEARQASLSITNSRSSLRLTSIESVMPSSHLILCHPLLLPPSTFPASGSFQWVSSSHQVAKVLEFQLQHQFFQRIFDWSPLGWTGWISLQSKGLSTVFSNTTVQKHQFFGAQLSLWSSPHIYMWPRVVLV